MIICKEGSKIELLRDILPDNDRIQDLISNYLTIVGVPFRQRYKIVITCQQTESNEVIHFVIMNPSSNTFYFSFIPRTTNEVLIELAEEQCHHFADYIKKSSLTKNTTVCTRVLKIDRYNVPKNNSFLICKNEGRAIFGSYKDV
jgi:hypothetical protein